MVQFYLDYRVYIRHKKTKLKIMIRVFSILTILFFLDACNGKANREAEIQKAKQATIDSINTIANTQHRVIDSMKTVEARKTEARRVEKNTQIVDNTATVPGEETIVKKKKGLGNVSKGAIIGAGTGAVAGAIIDKKHGEGAIVGGLIGAGAGAATGVIINQAQKKKKKKAAVH
jgi:hypothetical protein